MTSTKILLGMILALITGLKMRASTNGCISPDPAFSNFEEILQSSKFRKLSKNMIIEKSCLDSFGPIIKDQALEAMENGLTCLRDLKTKESLKLANSLNLLLSSEKNILSCQKLGDRQGAVIGSSSVNSLSNRPNENLVHPYIILNSDKLTDKAGKIRSITKLQGTIFHEALHNLGRAHGDGPETSYTCEDCCFSEGNDKLKNLACKVCGGDYKGVTSSQYILDILPWAEETSSIYKINLPKIVNDGLIKFPGSPEYLEGLIHIQFSESVINQLMAKYLVEHKILSSDFSKLLASQPISKEAEKTLPFYEAVTKSRIALFYKGDKDEAINLYKSINLDEVKSIMKKFKEDKEYELLYQALDHMNGDLSLILENPSLDKEKARELEKVQSELSKLI